MRNARGFALVEIVVAVVVVVIVAATAYLFFNRPSSNATTDSTPKSYQTAQDLDQAKEELESTDIDAELDASLKELDNEAAAF